MPNLVIHATHHQNAQIARIAASDAGIGVLEDMQEKWRFACDELQRMQDDGGNAPNEEENTKVDAYFMASQRIKIALENAQ